MNEYDQILLNYGYKSADEVRADIEEIMKEKEDEDVQDR